MFIDATMVGHIQAHLIDATIVRHIQAHLIDVKMVGQIQAHLIDIINKHMKNLEQFWIIKKKMF